MRHPGRVSISAAHAAGIALGVALMRAMSGDPVIQFSRRTRKPLDPAEPGYGVGHGPVLAADPPGIAARRDVCEEVAVGDLAGARLAAVGAVGDLDVADVR